MVEEIIVSICTGGVGLFLLKWFREYWEARTDRSHEKVYKRINAVYIILSQIIEKTPAKRVTILRSQDGGGVPRLGKTLTSSTLYEIGTEDLPRREKSWHNQTLDKPYITLLLELIREKDIRIDTEHLAPGVLKDKFLYDKVEFTKAYWLGSTSKHGYYLFIQYLEDTLPPEHLRELNRSYVTQLRELFEEA